MMSGVRFFTIAQVSLLVALFGALGLSATGCKTIYDIYCQEENGLTGEAFQECKRAFLYIASDYTDYRDALAVCSKERDERLGAMPKFFTVPEEKLELWFDEANSVINRYNGCRVGIITHFYDLQEPLRRMDGIPEGCFQTIRIDNGQPECIAASADFVDPAKSTITH